MAVKAMKRVVIFVLCILLILSGCSKETSLYITKENGMYTASFLSMDTVISFSVISRNAEKNIQKAYEQIVAYDAAFSAHSEDSEVSEANHSSGNSIYVSDELAQQIYTALKVSKMTDGAFDITVLPLMKLWGFYNRNYTVPDETSIANTIKLIGYEKIQLEDNILFMQEGTQIDLGAVSKGFAGQKAAQLLMDLGVDSGMLSLGGNMQVFGLNSYDSVWNIAIQDPYDESAYVGIIHNTDCSIITSGSYQRYFEENDKIYHHIIDPHTGYPAESGLVSVTIIADDGTYADALSTGLFVTGLDKAVEIWKEYQDFEAVFITENNTIYITEGLIDKFTSSSEAYTFEYIYK